MPITADDVTRATLLVESKREALAKAEEAIKICASELSEAERARNAASREVELAEDALARASGPQVAVSLDTATVENLLQGLGGGASLDEYTRGVVCHALLAAKPAN